MVSALYHHVHHGHVLMFHALIDTTTKAILLRFKVEVQLPSSSRLRMVRVNFIQQQGI